MNDWKYTKDNPLRVFEAFAGYGSQSMALRNIVVPVLEAIFTQMFRADSDTLF